MECGPLSLSPTFSSVKRAQLTYNANANKRANIANVKVCVKLAKSKTGLSLHNRGRCGSIFRFLFWVHRSWQSDDDHRHYILKWEISGNLAGERRLSADYANVQGTDT